MDNILQYCEPDENGNVKIIRHTVKEAINMMKAYAQKHGFSYSSDKEAINEFMALHWAYWVET